MFLKFKYSPVCQECVCLLFRAEQEVHSGFFIENCRLLQQKGTVREVRVNLNSEAVGWTDKQSVKISLQSSMKN